MENLNINLQPKYWDNVWANEAMSAWRIYPGCFGRIAWAVGHFNDVLDLGCGSGILTRKLQEFGNNVTGLDISEIAIKQLPEGIQGIVGTLPNIPLPDASFDVVVATEVLEHLNDDTACIQEIARVVRPGGRAYIAVPDNCLGPEEEPEHVRKYTPESLAALIKPYGEFYVETFIDEFSVNASQRIALPTIMAAIYF